jgi:phosphoribosylformylglycinamidine synthase PurS subunit
MKRSVEVIVRLKEGVLDPEGKTIAGALSELGFAAVKSVAVGKRFVIEIEAGSDEEATDVARAAADKLLANPVIEVSRVRMLAGAE